MRKIFSVIMFALIIFCGQNQIKAADIWIYTDNNGAEYYLREYNLAARSWCFAHVVKVQGNYTTDLAYKFDIYPNIPYSVCYGSDAGVFVSRNPPTIFEKGYIVDNPIAYKIWKDYLGPLDAERQERFRRHSEGR